MARIRNTCPPGILCITPSLIILVVVIFILISLFVFYVYNTSKPVVSRNYVEPPLIQAASQQPSIAINVERGGDDRYTRAPKPLRNWLNPVDIEGAPGTIPVIATRGIPESYQSMGIVTTSSGELLPLYGRRVASRSDRFNYYTRSDTNNPIPLPVNYKKRDCQDDVGCDELYDGDNIEIVPTKQRGTVTIYRFNGPTYIPGLI